LNSISLETTDLFRAAFYLCMGGDLDEIRFSDNGKRLGSFLFTGPDLRKHDRNYINGHAMVNPVQYQVAINHLRDTLFKQLRNENHAKDVAGRRYDYDRKRKNRAHQKYY